MLCRSCVFYAKEHRDENTNRAFCTKHKSMKEDSESCDQHFDLKDITTEYKEKVECRPTPEPGQMYRHYKGDLYMILGVGKNKSKHYDGQPEVVYEDSEGNWYTRPVCEFLDKVWLDGIMVNRFTLEVGISWN